MRVCNEQPGVWSPHTWHAADADNSVSQSPADIVNCHLRHIDSDLSFRKGHLEGADSAPLSANAVSQVPMPPAASRTLKHVTTAVPNAFTLGVLAMDQ